MRAVVSSPPDPFARLPAIEEEVAELERQLDALAVSGTDFAVRVERRTTTLIAAIDELRSAGPAGGRLPRDFWARTAGAVTALTAARQAARAVLREERL
jgi:hypothetical protein